MSNKPAKIETKEYRLQDGKMVETKFTDAERAELEQAKKDLEEAEKHLNRLWKHFHDMLFW